MSVSLKEAYIRIDDTLDCCRPVILTDGTYTAYVTKVFGDADDPTENCLTLVMGDHFTAKHLDANRHGILDGVALRDTKDYLLVGPDWYLKKWPCDCTECKALRGKYCSVANCVVIT